MAKEVNRSILPITLSRTLGIWEVTLLGVGALLGGGIFTLLGQAAGLSGGALVFAILLGSGIAFLNLNSYVSLATTFPTAGGGYNWIREGLGEMQGFLSGWFSWMASSVACSLYAVSFGIFAVEFFFSFLALPSFDINPQSWRIIFAIAIIIFFGLINLRGVSFSGKIGGYISLFILSLLLSYIIFGIKRMITFPGLMAENFSHLFPFGISGVLQAAGLFYIAFEGSEIQAQTGEETKDPARTLKIGLFTSWAIISLLYLLISFVIIGATTNNGMPSWKLLDKYSERAIIESAKQFLPGGYALMIVAGSLANLAALNATIYSSSRVLFAMARDKFIWQRLGLIHELNRTPHRAILLSTLVTIFIAVFLPLKDIAGAADMLFIALFMQLNLAYVELRRKRPEWRWHYVVPYGPILPLLAVALYVLLSISLFHVSPLGIYFTIFWFLLGLVNYFAYTQEEKREDFKRETVYEHTSRLREKSGYRVVLPVAPEEHWREISQIAMAIVQSEDGELLAMRIHEVPPTLPLDAGFHKDHETRVLERVEKLATEKKLNVVTRLLATRSIPEAILETVKTEKGDLLILGWDGYVNSKGFVFGRKIDVVLHRARCDLLVIKLIDLEHMRKILIPVSTNENPNLHFAGKTATALLQWFGGETTVAMVIPEKTVNLEYTKYFAILEDRMKELKIKSGNATHLKLIRSDNVASAILKESIHYDVVLLPAGRGRITKAIGVGSIPEQIAKHCRKTVIIAKGHRGIIQPFFDYLRSRF